MTNLKRTRSNLVKRLRKPRVFIEWNNGKIPDPLCTEAARCIEALEAENERLRQTGAFLLARLDDLEWLDGQLEETARDYFGHVEPAIYHFRAALEARHD